MLLNLNNYVLRYPSSTVFTAFVEVYKEKDIYVPVISMSASENKYEEAVLEFYEAVITAYAFFKTDPNHKFLVDSDGFPVKLSYTFKELPEFYRGFTTKKILITKGVVEEIKECIL